MYINCVLMYAVVCYMDIVTYVQHLFIVHTDAQRNAVTFVVGFYKVCSVISLLLFLVNIFLLVSKLQKSDKCILELGMQRE